MYNPGKNGFIYLKGKIGSFVSFFLSRIDRKTVLFYETDGEALLLKEELEFFTGRDVHLFPPYSNKVFEKEDEMKRTGFLSHLASDDAFFGLFPYSAINHPLSPVQAFEDQKRQISFGDTVFREDLIQHLDKMGYELTTLVREEGEYAKRGSIVDAFPPSYGKPVRIEFLGDEILSLRSFDPLTQRSHGELEKCNLVPVKTNGGEEAALSDYFDDNMVFVHKGLQNLLLVVENVNHKEQLRQRCLSGLNINVSGIEGDESDTLIEAVSNEDLRLLLETKKSEMFRILSEKMTREWHKYRYVYIFASSMRQGERLRDIFKNYGISLPILNAISFSTRERESGIVIGPLRRGFRTSDIVLLTEEDIVGPKKRVVKKRKSNGIDEFITSFKDLQTGEWVVHVEHGIGVYKGLTELKVAGYTKDFLQIEYQDSDKLYVPIDDLHLVQKFIGGEKAKPKIDRLGSQSWKTTKRKVRKQVEDIAKELLEIYAEREMAEGYAYPPEDELFREMESRFEFEETEGQSEAIEAVLNDLKSAKPMDRVICGDVGFGKTEVAIRASFKVVIENRQVALLVPTTILAQQHFKTFQGRFVDYPINIEMLSRFRSREEQKHIVERVKKGSVDIIIGTHRLLQKDLAFRDLGLLIIDEEHRFGVKHKELLKQARKNVDVLTLSATPIPRTLYMATSGIRDLSVINTPPLDRLAVKTSVVKFKDNLIHKAVMKELERGGQVFFVHNFIHNIGVVHNHLSKLVPDARIVVAHGRMDGKTLEKIMFDFIDRKYDILLSTNIIESGLDISNVNTIFINNAHKMGLAELYQLRGRVGRSTKQAYAYLLVPKDETLKKDSLLRLKIIEELSELGSGFHVANYDLEIRGAGNLLGKEQSGNINLIGFELYCLMLEDAITNLKHEGTGVRREEEIVPEINIPVDAFIPDTYIEDPAQKLLIYKRLSKVRSGSELIEMENELKDRYGEVPGPLENLLEIISLKALLFHLKIKKIEHSSKQFMLHVTERTPINMENLLHLVREGKEKIKLLPDGRIIIETEKKGRDAIVFTRNILMRIVTI
ncbi:MAG: transcription-repair coupling factor [Syntrophobacterales bacterium]|jgi:transcription-repair coupling factor (superfamily II helicase)|nr:transcription-repair coupling factor [Syntrophobacterales bacterium]